MVLVHKPWAMLRFGAVFLCMSIITLSYYSFSHYVHNPHSFFPHGRNDDHGNNNHTHVPFPHGNGTDDHHQRRGGPFEGVYLKKQDLFLYGLALPLVLLTVAALIWNPSTKTTALQSETSLLSPHKSPGEVNVFKWTLVWFLTPLFVIMLAGSHGLGYWSGGMHHNPANGSMKWNWYISICMSLMSPSGYAAAWSLALFLIPVTKHSPILDWLRVTPVQALAFHRVAGWTGLWNSILHGYLHLRHLMDVLNGSRPNPKPWYVELKILLVPANWECVQSQNPFVVWFGSGAQVDIHDEDFAGGHDCWLALVNATGMISTIAFVILGLTSLPQVRRASYTLFYLTHIPMAWIMLIMAIWHYPTCALVLIPNMIYYLSFHIPVYVHNFVAQLRSSSSPLMEAHWIRGGSLELVFAVDARDRPRHESRFAKISHPSISWVVSHPFSVYSPHDLRGDTDETSTVSVLLKPSGPFTQELTRMLFPHLAQDDGASQEENDTEALRPLLASNDTSDAAARKIQLDSFYAGSFDWTHRAMLSHDELLLVAGGVGIVPFLDFLPSLRQHIVADVGPRCIELHWYCREVGLASYVWTKYLRRHVHEAWEEDPACRGRLTIHLHLTSQATQEEEHSTTLLLPHDDAVVATQPFVSTTPARDMFFAQSRVLRLLVPGSILVGGMALHGWFYKAVIMDEHYRDENLAIRANGVLWTLLLALVVSIVTELILCHGQKKQPTIAREAAEHPRTNQELSSNDNNDGDDGVLFISKGRTPVERIVHRMMTQAARPGVYLCGPHAMMTSVEEAIRGQRKDCAFYREDSEL